MKKIILLCFAVLFTVVCKSQVVYGTDINTTIGKFSKILTSKGFKLIESVSGTKRYDVTFAGFKNVVAVIDYNTKTDTIRNIRFEFKGRDVSENSHAFYGTLYDQFKQKYPKGKEIVLDWPGFHSVSWVYFPEEGGRVSIDFSETENDLSVSYASKQYGKKQDMPKISDDI